MKRAAGWQKQMDFKIVTASVKEEDIPLFSEDHSFTAMFISLTVQNFGANHQGEKHHHHHHHLLIFFSPPIHLRSRSLGAFS
jgi:hypothetical protein